MVGTCANPACRAPFHNVHQGKLFRVEAASAQQTRMSTPEPPMFTPVRRRVQYFWLCESCAKTMRVVQDGTGGIRIEPLVACA